MKKLIQTILPSLLIFIFIFIDSVGPSSHNIIVGIYVLFPILYILQSIVLKDSEINLAIGFILSSIVIMVMTQIFYNMSSMIPALIVYIILGEVSFVFANKIRKSKNKV